MRPALSRAEWAYTAGLIDGEGCIYSSSANPGYRLNVRVSNTNRAVLDWLRDRFGGAIHVSANGVGSWRAPRDGLEWLLRGVRSYLVVKRDQATALLDMVTLSCCPKPYTPDVKSEQERLHLALKRMKEGSRTCQTQHHGTTP